MGFSSASCRSVMIRRPAAYKAAALPAELRQRYRNPPRLSGCRLPEKTSQTKEENRSVLVEKEPSTGFGPVTCALRGRCSAS